MPKAEYKVTPSYIDRPDCSQPHELYVRDDDGGWVFLSIHPNLAVARETVKRFAYEKTADDPLSCYFDENANEIPRGEAE